MVRLKLPPEEKRSEVVFVHLRPCERRALEAIVARGGDGKSRGSVLRNAFLAQHTAEVLKEIQQEQAAECKPPPPHSAVFAGERA